MKNLKKKYLTKNAEYFFYNNNFNIVTQPSAEVPTSTADAIMIGN